jgi:hypothetical protein
MGAAGATDAALLALMRAIAGGETAVAAQLLAASPPLARARLAEGAARRSAQPYFLDAIRHYVYAGDTALHVAAAAHCHEIARALIAAGAEVRAQNRRGAEPLHYAADGSPGAAYWSPQAQGATIVFLIAAGADPNAADKSGTRPLHRAVRTRGATAVQALLDGGADPHRKTRRGSTAMRLATVTSGRGGSGSPEAKAQQAEIVRLLKAYGGPR